MGGKAKKPDPVPVSQGEKIQAQLAKDQIGYYRSTYAPLEKTFGGEAGRDYSDRLSAQVGSGGMREMTGGLQSLATGTAPVDTSAIASSVTDGRVDALSQGRRARDDGRLAAAGVGLGITGDAGTMLTDAGRVQTNSAIESVRAKMDAQAAKNSVKQAGMAAIGTLAGAYGSYKLMDGMANKTDPYTGTPQSSPVSLSSPAQNLVANRGKPFFGR